MVTGGIRASAGERQAQASRIQGLTIFLSWALAVEGAQESEGEAGLRREADGEVPGLAGEVLGLGLSGWGLGDPGSWEGLGLGDTGSGKL